MNIAIGSDHRGLKAVEGLRTHLRTLGHHVEQLGPCNGESCDYPDSAYQVAVAVRDGRADRGILLCSNGVGMSIAANKVHGIRAALIYDESNAEQSRRHNNTNVLCLGAESQSEADTINLIDIWLDTPFEGGRHERRVNKITAIEEGKDPATAIPTPAPPAPTTS